MRCLLRHRFGVLSALLFVLMVLHTSNVRRYRADFVLIHEQFPPPVTIRRALRELGSVVYSDGSFVLIRLQAGAVPGEDGELTEPGSR
ncbi:MAG: hypothetical protein ACE5JI_03095 [Acidobacteriota bacterium]